jgi:hypothetical protein
MKFRNWRTWPDIHFQLPLLIGLIVKCYLKGIRPYELLKVAPDIEHGGFVFFSKYETNNLFNKENILTYELIPATESQEKKIAIVEEFMKKEKLTYPVIIKPNIGHSGKGVIKVDSKEEAKSFLKTITSDYIIQEYCDWPLEFGVFYYKLKGKGQIYSINQKVIPVVKGDGLNTIDTLMKQKRETKFSRKSIPKELQQYIPKKGEEVPVTTIANIEQGAIYKDTTFLATKEIIASIEKTAGATRFFYGKLDIKTKSIAAFKKGEFKIIEINGVTSIASSYFDPTYNVFKAYQIIARQYNILLKIALENKYQKMQVMPLLKIIQKAKKTEKNINKNHEKVNSFRIVRKGVPVIQKIIKKNKKK